MDLDGVVERDIGDTCPALGQQIEQAVDRQTLERLPQRGRADRPPLAEVGRRPRVVAAAVDRAGADLFAIDHADLDTDGVVDGEHERIHKSSGDGHDQAGYPAALAVRDGDAVANARGPGGFPQPDGGGEFLGTADVRVGAQVIDQLADRGLFFRGV